jgi:zinc protease
MMASALFLPSLLDAQIASRHESLRQEAPAPALPSEGTGGQTGKPTMVPGKSITLPNGLQVIAIEDHNVPLVTVDIAVRNGAFTEPDEFAGLSHLYEHMFFKANKSLPSQTDFMKRVRKLGITFNGYTSEEVVTYFFTLPSKNLEPGMQFMSAAIQTPLFDSTELVREREVVLGEFDRNEAQPEFTLYYALDSALWNPYVSRKQALGQRHVIKTATVEKMRMIQKRFYVPNNSALIISGDIDPDQVLKLAQKYFSDWQRGADPFPSYAPPAFPPLRPQLVIREAKLPFVDESVTFRGPSVGKDEPAVFQAQLLATIADQRGSRLYRRLVDSGIAMSFSATYDEARNVGPVYFNVQTTDKNARRALDIIKEEIRGMARPGYFTEDEIAIAKKIIADRPIFDRDNVFGYTIRTLAPWWSIASIDYYLRIPMRVGAVSRNDLASFASSYLVGQPFVVGVGADHAAIAGLNIPQEILQW